MTARHRSQRQCQHPRSSPKRPAYPLQRCACQTLLDSFALLSKKGRTLCLQVWSCRALSAGQPWREVVAAHWPAQDISAAGLVSCMCVHNADADMNCIIPGGQHASCAFEGRDASATTPQSGACACPCADSCAEQQQRAGRRLQFLLQRRPGQPCLSAQGQASLKKALMNGLPVRQYEAALNGGLFMCRRRQSPSPPPPRQSSRHPCCAGMSQRYTGPFTQRTAHHAVLTTKTAHCRSACLPR